MPQWEGSEVRGEKRKSHLAKGTAKSMILGVDIRYGREHEPYQPVLYAINVVKPTLR